MEYQGFEGGSKSLTVRQLTLIFVGAVALCALFFAMGFVVGANEHNSSSVPVVEQVPPANRDTSLAPQPSKTENVADNGEPGEQAPPGSAGAGQSAAPAGAPDSSSAAASSTPQSSLSTNHQQNNKAESPPVSGLNGTVAEAMGAGGDHAAAANLSRSPVASSRRKASAADGAGPAPSAEGIIIQVAALREMQDAKSLVDVLKSRNYPAFIVTPAQAHTSDGIYRVQVGPFSNKTLAEKTRQRLAQQGFKTFYKR